MTKIMFFYLSLILGLTACLFNPPDLPISSLTPSQGKTLLNNQWRLTEVVYNGVQGDFDSIVPVLATFDSDTLLVHACNGFVLIFEAAGDDTQAYQFTAGASTARDCPHGGTEQEAFISQALAQTYNYELAGETLVLFGEQARVTFVIDNEAKKPSN